LTRFIKTPGNVPEFSFGQRLTLMMSAAGPSRRFWNVRTTVAIGGEADIEPAALNKPDLGVNAEMRAGGFTRFKETIDEF
jgi:hypothetical protein